MRKLLHALSAARTPQYSFSLMFLHVISPRLVSSSHAHIFVIHISSCQLNPFHQMPCTISFVQIGDCCNYFRKRVYNHHEFQRKWICIPKKNGVALREHAPSPTASRYIVLNCWQRESKFIPLFYHNTFWRVISNIIVALWMRQWCALWYRPLSWDDVKKSVWHHCGASCMMQTDSFTFFRLQGWSNALWTTTTRCGAITGA